MSATGARTPDKPLTYDQFKAKKTRRTITHPVVTDDDAVTAYKLAEEALKDAKRRGDHDAAAKHEADMAEAEQAIRESTILMRLRAMPRKGERSYTTLKAEHPPTAEDDAEVAELTGKPDAKARWHSDTFGPALVAACLIEPAVTVEQAVELAADMNEAEWNRLLWAAINVNENATDTAGLVFS